MPNGKPAKYLVCVDSHAESLTALKLACAKARQRQGHVHMIHVIPPADFQALQTVAEHMQNERRAEAEALLKKLAGMAMGLSGIMPAMVLREGETGDEILAAAEVENDAIMLVLGTAEHTSTRGKLTAWLAAQLGHKLFIPLLLVPGNLTDQQLEALI